MSDVILVLNHRKTNSDPLYPVLQLSGAFNLNNNRDSSCSTKILWLVPRAKYLQETLVTKSKLVPFLMSIVQLFWVGNSCGKIVGCFYHLRQNKQTNKGTK